MTNQLRRLILIFLFIRPVNSVLDKEAIEPVEEALVNTCKHVDSHYTYTAKRGEEDHSDDESGSIGNAPDGDDLDFGNGFVNGVLDC